MKTAFTGRGIEIRYRSGLLDTAGNPAHAATFIRLRLIVLDRELRRRPEERERILAHEIFHFVWVRLGNAVRVQWEDILRSEFLAMTAGEAGWSAEWRKTRLHTHDLERRTSAWREYCCESFCDTAAAWITGTRAEVTLPRRKLLARFAWLSMEFGGRLLPI